MLFLEEDYWNNIDVKGNLYDNLIGYLKHHKLTYDDIEFITVKQRPTFKEEDECDHEDCDTCPYVKWVEFDKEDFKTLAKNVDITNVSDGVRFVGKDFFISSDCDSFLEIVKFSERPKETLNVALAALTMDDDESDLAYHVGITHEREDDR